MKRFVFSLLAIVIGFFIVAFSALSVGRSQVGASEELAASDSGELVGSEVGTSEANMGEDYYLPYPGILPDHSLYFLKMIRDRFRLVVTRDQAAKFDLLVLYADKRIGAAEVLVKGGKDNLGVTTAIKAERYLFDAAEASEGLEEESLNRLKKSVAKHKSILDEMVDNLETDQRDRLEEALESNKMVVEDLGVEYVSEEEVFGGVEVVDPSLLDVGL